MHKPNDKGISKYAAHELKGTCVSFDGQNDTKEWDKRTIHDRVMPPFYDHSLLPDSSSEF